MFCILNFHKWNLKSVIRNIFVKKLLKQCKIFSSAFLLWKALPFNKRAFHIQTLSILFLIVSTMYVQFFVISYNSMQNLAFPKIPQKVLGCSRIRDRKWGLEQNYNRIRDQCLVPNSVVRFERGVYKFKKRFFVFQTFCRVDLHKFRSLKIDHFLKISWYFFFPSIAVNFSNY